MLEYQEVVGYTVAVVGGHIGHICHRRAVGEEGAVKDRMRWCPIQVASNWRNVWRRIGRSAAGSISHE
mgnify:CR=1 FL=1